MSCYAEKPFFENWVLFVPECERCTKVLMSVAISAHSVFTLENLDRSEMIMYTHR